MHDKKFYIELLFIVLTSISPLSALALVTGSKPPAAITSPPLIPNGGPTNLGEFYKIFNNVVGWVFAIAMILGVLILIIAGIIYMTAGGDQTKASKAMKMVMYALIGVAVAALAWSLVNVVGNYFINTKLIGP